MVEVENPFAAYLAGRPTVPATHDLTKLSTGTCSDTQLPKATCGDADPFAAYLAGRPNVSVTRDLSKLSSGESSDIQFSKAASGKEVTESLVSFLAGWKPTPEQTPSLAQSFRKDGLHTKSQSKLQAIASGLQSSESSTRTSTRSATPLLQRSSSVVAVPASPSQPLKPLSQSMPSSNLHRNTSLPVLPNLNAWVGSAVAKPSHERSAASTGRTETTVLPPLDPRNRSAQWSATEQEVTVLHGWYSKRRCWNLSFKGKQGQEAKRSNLMSPGGCVVFGDGQMPVLNDRRGNFLGRYFSFRVDAVDEEHFPLETLKDMTLGFGVLRHPPHDKRCDNKLYAYEVPSSVVVGFGAHVIDGGKWKRSPWDARNLKKDDYVSVLITPEGDFIVYVNSKQVLRVQTSLGDDENMQTLYPVVDLHGRVSAVSLKERRAPPNTTLKPRDTLEKPR